MYAHGATLTRVAACPQRGVCDCMCWRWRATATVLLAPSPMKAAAMLAVEAVACLTQAHKLHLLVSKANTDCVGCALRY